VSDESDSVLPPLPEDAASLPPPIEPISPTSRILEYRRASRGSPYLHMTPPIAPYWVQVLAGLGTWLAGVGLFFIALNSPSLPFHGANGETFSVIGVFALFAGQIFLITWVNVRFRWRGFLPGFFIGLGLTCLVPVGIVAVVCGMGK